MSLTIRTNMDNKGFGISEPQNRNQNKKSIDARSLTLNPTTNPVDAKRNSARKQAMRLISNAWSRDEKVAKNIQGMWDEKQTKIDELNELKSRTKNIEDEKKMYKEAYGISDDSEEQKDLELLEKYQNNRNGSASDSFSEEEIDRLKELQSKPLTEYQKKVLSLNSVKGKMDIDIDRKKAELMAMTGDIAKAENEANASQDMLDAQNAADTLMEAATKDIVGMLVQEAKDHIDETADEQKEKAEEAKKEKEEQEERIEKAKEDREEQEKIIEADMEADELQQNVKLESQNVDHVEEAQKSIQRILSNNHMINEDIKGIEIDLNF